MSGLLLRRMQEWQKKRRIQLINSRNKISLELKEHKCENQISIKIPVQSKIEINNNIITTKLTIQKLPTPGTITFYQQSVL